MLENIINIQSFFIFYLIIINFIKLKVKNKSITTVYN